MDTPSQSGKSLHCAVVTPERTLFDETVDFVALPMYDGELGVLPGRAPLIGRLGFGELRTVVGRTVHRYYVDGGFAQIRNNVVTVLTPRAMPALRLAARTVCMLGYADLPSHLRASRLTASRYAPLASAGGLLAPAPFTGTRSMSWFTTAVTPVVPRSASAESGRTIQRTAVRSAIAWL